MVIKNLVRILILMAWLVAPMGMLGSHTAMASTGNMQAATSDEHCTDMAGSHDQSSDEQAPAKSIECIMDCMMLCSGILTMTPQLAERMEPSPMALAVSLSSLVRGLTPQAEPRPPQFS